MSPDWSKVGVYPDNGMVRGEYTAIDKARNDAEWLYDQMVCDRRYDVDSVILMLALWNEERNQ